MNFPTHLHARVAALFAGFFEHREPVDTILVVNSCARGRATPESDLDLAALVVSGTPQSAMPDLEAAWSRFAARNGTVAEFLEMGPFSHVHIDVFDGSFVPPVWDEGGGPDSFEIEIGNRIAHSMPLTGAGPYFEALQEEWLPFYDSVLQERRIRMAREACAYSIRNLHHLYKRGLHFHAFDKLYKAYQEFLQGIFISRQTYPVAYTKWIHEQVVEWLELPELYEDLPRVISVRDIESGDLVESADLLSELLEHWVTGSL
jgi:hypothetical protein